MEIAALSMLINNSTLQKTWFSAGAHAVMGSVWGCTQRIGEYFSLRERNDSLALENAELRVRLARLEHLEDELIRDSIMLNSGIAGDYRYIPASVLKISKGLHHNYIIIDKGEVDGVLEGSGIITGKGAVGIVDAVSRNFSYARSFQNPNTSISARIGRNGSTGALEWTAKGRNKAVLKEIPHHIPYEKGDTVYTSGYSSIFPPDIPLGTIQGARIVNGATYEMDITLFEDFGGLRYVTVVNNTGYEEIKSLERDEK